MLFDLEADPNEPIDLGAHPDYAGVRAHLTDADEIHRATRHVSRMLFIDPRCLIGVDKQPPACDRTILRLPRIRPRLPRVLCIETVRTQIRVIGGPGAAVGMQAVVAL